MHSFIYLIYPNTNTHNLSLEYVPISLYFTTNAVMKKQETVGGVWRDGPAIMDTYCSSEAPELCSQKPLQATHS